MPKISVLLITMILFGTQLLSAQNYLNYYDEINNAELAHLDTDFKKSDAMYQVAFALVDRPFKDDCLLAALNAEQLKDYRKTYDYLSKGVSVGLTKKRILKELPKFKKYDYWDTFENEYEAKRAGYVNALDMELRDELLEMVEKDQAVRHPIFGSWKKAKKVDQINYELLLKIIIENNKKWPDRFLIGDGNQKGKYTYGEITIMLHHFSKEEVLTLKPYLIASILSGGLSPYNVAYPLDYTNLKIIGKKGNYRYTCLHVGSYNAAKDEKVEICDCEKATQEREKIGLESLDDYYRKRNSSYNCYDPKEWESLND
ncbi:hypothetical protein [Cellulophaga sp. Z1A5H]|uniref:hypothetical protein n=1 Tax=Cellulophaga sp. Z1A5H TaxID=2687291 RepID=UPI0013FD5A80|nr:hypothetical protein [Cellulophaga sp. Z1A5H]